MPPETEITIGPLYLRKYLDDVLGTAHHDCAIIHEVHALIISAADKDEQLCHVEMPDAENGLNYPRLWRIKPWKESYHRYLKVKKRSEEDRVKACIFKENVDRIIKKLRMATGITDNDDSLRTIAQVIVKKKDINMAKQLGVNDLEIKE